MLESIKQVVGLELTVPWEDLGSAQPRPCLLEEAICDFERPKIPKDFGNIADEVS